MMRAQPPQQPMHGSGYPPAPYQLQQHQGQPSMNGQQQQQQQQQQHQAGGSAGGSSDAQSQANSGGANGGMGEMNLASVLHYLQSEWRRWERDRNEWEIERAEMRARIALLEGQRRSAENLKVDLLRRVKMLEYALRQERSRTFGTAGKAGSIAPSRLIALQEDDKASSRDEKEGSGSEGSEEGSSTFASRAVPDTSPWKAVGGVPKNDPKARARSREYLKQCLQEVTYLTSPGALNPLPSRPPVTLDDNISELNDPSKPEHGLDRPTKTLPENLPSTSQPEATPAAEEERPKKPLPSYVSSGLSKQDRSENGHHANDRPSGPSSLTHSAAEDTGRKRMQSHTMAVEATARPPSSPAVKTVGLPESEPNGTGTTRKGLGTARGGYSEASLKRLDTSSDNAAREFSQESSSAEASGGGSQLLTAIYRPESKAAWREELRAANEKAERLRSAQNKSGSEQSDEEQLANIGFSTDDDEVKAEGSEIADKVWTTRRSLKSHLDIVRSVAFAHGPGGLIASGGDDNTVKVWAVEYQNIMGKRPSANELEPIKTYRGHTAPVTTVTISSAHSAIFSASLDSTIRVWKLPRPSDELYASFDPSAATQTLEGHTDAVWDLVLLPGTADGNGKANEDRRLVSCAADGSVKVWSLDSKKWSLTESWTLGEGDDVPTSLSVYNHDFGQVLVGFSSGLVKLVNVETGAVVLQLGEAKKDAQVNAVLSHPTLPAVIVAHEDGYLRVYESKSTTTTPTHTILAHPKAITSLSLSPLSPMAVLTASVDCTVRLWDLNKQTSLQEFGGHRKKSDEGVCCVASHPELPVVASAGADGVIRLWAAT